jgi:hypothetical protein
MRPLLILLAAFLLAAVPGPVSAADKFAPHRALYDMNLRYAERDANIVAVRGEMLADWGETCEGWTLEHRSTFDIEIAGEDPVRVTTNVTSFEAKDGLTYRFSVRNVERDGSEDRIEGVARLDGRGKGGTVTFTKPEERTIPLPAGTVFPTAHSEEALALAGAQSATFKRIVFDGLSGDGLFEVSAVIGAPHAAGPAERDAVKGLAQLRSWPAQIAFFRHGSADAAPDNEMSFRMYENGVTDDMTIDFGTFKVLARLKALELSPRPSCR